MSIRTIIIDDEAPARRRIQKLLTSDARCSLVAEAESGKEAVEVIRKHNPDLLILDIQLKDMTGFDVLDRVRHSFNGVVIFITAYDEYAIKAFEANALDYLLKPFKNARFAESLSRVLNTLNRNQVASLEQLRRYLSGNAMNKKNILIKEGRTIHYLDPNQLFYIQSEGYYCNFHIGDTFKMIRISLKTCETMLPLHFVRVNRSVIINKNKIDSVRRLSKSVEVFLISGEKFTANYHLEELGYRL